MYKYLLILPILFCMASCHMEKGKTRLTVTVDSAREQEYSFTLYESDSVYQLAATPGNPGSFSTESEGTPRIVRLFGVVGNDQDKWQVSVPLYLKPGENLDLILRLGDRQATAEIRNADKNNNALIAYNQFYQDHVRRLWINTPTPEEAPAILKEFMTQAETIIGKEHPGKPVADYLNIWGYLEYLNNQQSIRFIYSRQKGMLLPDNIGQGLPSPELVLDNTTALLFPGTTQQINRYLEKEAATPEERIRTLREKFHTPEIIKAVTISVLTDYATDYNYSEEFENGALRLENMSRGLGEDSAKLVADFRSKQYSVEGAPLPDIEVEDISGKTYKLSDLMGKNLYIDLWASWCVPCCAEVPHLQKLEKTLKNKEVRFISISIDTDKAAWKNRMEQLHMEGNQYIVKDQSLNKTLNINGIPHFLIYGKDGRMTHYNAPRPSAPETGELLEKLL